MITKKKLVSFCLSSVIAAMYVALTYLQELIFPGTSSMAVQFRVSEALMILCVFSPSAVYGVTLGCFVSNFINISVLPLDIVIGSLATFLSAVFMYKLKGVKFKGLPIVSALMPALFNGVIIGLETEIFYLSGAFTFTGFLLSSLTVALGEVGVLCTLGLLLYCAIKKRGLHKKLFEY